MLDKITTRLNNHPVQTDLAKGGGDIYAAVLVPVVNNPIEPGIVLTKRSDNLSSHRGQVAFPGGKWDDTDASLLSTALREAHEEIDLHPDRVDVIAELPPHHTLQDTFVLPYVGLVPHNLTYVPNPGELDAVFTVPLEFLADTSNLTTFVFKDSLGEREMPCYNYEGFHIWGFTLSIIIGLLNYTLDAGLKLQYPKDVTKKYRLKPPYRIVEN